MVGSVEVSGDQDATPQTRATHTEICNMCTISKQSIDCGIHQSQHHRGLKRQTSIGRITGGGIHKIRRINRLSRFVVAEFMILITAATSPSSQRWFFLFIRWRKKKIQPFYKRSLEIRGIRCAALWEVFATKDPANPSEVGVFFFPFFCSFEFSRDRHCHGTRKCPHGL